MSESAEAFLDRLVTWRELGFNRCVHVPGYDTFAALPAWARTTLAEHASDPRNPTCDLDDFENARTYDPLWNAAQNQLRREGHIHNYLRMLWGKKILEWSESGRTALGTMHRGVRGAVSAPTVSAGAARREFPEPILVISECLGPPNSVITFSVPGSRSRRTRPPSLELRCRRGGRTTPAFRASGRRGRAVRPAPPVPA